MEVHLTRHAEIRMQQRGIPVDFVLLVCEYGAHVYDKRGGIVFHFDRRARRRLERKFGHDFVRLNAEQLNAYAVVSTDRHEVITVGKRFRRILH